MCSLHLNCVILSEATQELRATEEQFWGAVAWARNDNNWALGCEARSQKTRHVNPSTTQGDAPQPPGRFMDTPQPHHDPPTAPVRCPLSAIPGPPVPEARRREEGRWGGGLAAARHLLSAHAPPAPRMRPPRSPSPQRRTPLLWRRAGGARAGARRPPPAAGAGAMAAP